MRAAAEVDETVLRGLDGRSGMAAEGAGTTTGGTVEDVVAVAVAATYAVVEGYAKDVMVVGVLVVVVVVVVAVKVMGV